MSKKRKARKATKNIDYSKPIDLTKIGTNEDPCFGKLYDLSENECKRCGDCELCSITFSQSKLKAKRDKVEKNNRFKDMELTQGNKALTSWVGSKKKEGLNRSEVIKKAKKIFGSTRDEIKLIWKTL